MVVSEASQVQVKAHVKATGSAVPYNVGWQLPGIRVGEGDDIVSYCIASARHLHTRQVARRALTFIEKSKRALQFAGRVRPRHVQVVKHFGARAHNGFAGRRGSGLARDGRAQRALG